MAYLKDRFGKVDPYQYALDYLTGAAGSLPAVKKGAHDFRDAVLGNIEAFRLQARLPNVEFFFDEDGAVTSCLSEEDLQTYRRLFTRRWSAVEIALEASDRLIAKTLEPVRPAFPNIPQKPDWLQNHPFAGLENMEDLTPKQADEYQEYVRQLSASLVQYSEDISALTPEERRAYEEYMEALDRQFRACNAANIILDPHKKEWDRENAQFNFSSIPEGRQRRTYDIMRKYAADDPVAQPLPVC